MDVCYIPVESYEASWMFLDESLPISPSDLARIRPMCKIYSAALWRRYVHPTKRHLIRTTRKDYPFEHSGAVYDYVEAWNAHDFEPIRRILLTNIPWSTEQTIYFFWHKNAGIETDWEIFVRHWPNFLFEDEAAVLVAEGRPEVVSFTQGRLRFERRANPAA